VQSLAELDEPVTGRRVSAIRGGDHERAADILRHELIGAGPPDVLLVRVRRRKTRIRKYGGRLFFANLIVLFDRFDHFTD